MNISSTLRAALAALAVAGLAACGGGGGGSSASGDGSLRLALTDAPACGFDAVNVTIQKVRVHQSSSAGDNDAGWAEIALNPALRVDLLSLTNGVLAELGQTPLPAGKYTQLRLVLAENTITHPMANSVKPTGASETELTTPSGQQSGLKTNINIDIAANQMADFVLDFDACKSIVTAGNSGKYLLKPVLTVIPRMVTGLSGRVDSSLANGSTTVSLQSGGTTVRATAPTASGSFLLQPVPAGTYTFVLTAPGRTTTVIRDVPVVDATVATLGTSTLVLNPAVSPTGTLSGTVTTGLTPIDAMMRSLQTLTSGPTIELIARPVDGTTGAYSQVLPTAAPQVATWAGSAGMPVFSADTAAAGRYSLQAISGGSPKNSATYTLTAGANISTLFTFP